MFVIAVTGGLGAGKSEVVDGFATRGAHVIDLDSLAKSLLEPGEEVRDAVVAAFGDAVVDADGLVSARRLGREAFSCQANAATLNAIVHPEVIRRTFALLEELAGSDVPPAVVVVEIPLLAENPALAESVDLVIAVEAPVEARVARAVARGLSVEDARARVAVQASDEERRAIADVVISNEGTAEDLAKSIEHTWEEDVLPNVP